jgi:formiminotetrahydrofolate cyclodeaminase
MLADMTISTFLDKVASDSPFPGGGSVAALAASLAAGLCEMVANLTIGKRGYESAWEDMICIAKEVAELRSRLMADIDRDFKAYQVVMDSYRLLRMTPDEKQARADAIENAMKGAAIVPMDVAKDVVRVMELFGQVIRKGNKNAAADGMVGVLMARSAALAALHNVRVNLDSIRDADFVKEMQEQAEILRTQAVHREKEISGGYYSSVT